MAQWWQGIRYVEKLGAPVFGKKLFAANPRNCLPVA